MIVADYETVRESAEQLASLRADELIATRREGKMVYYSLASSEAARVVRLMYELYCEPALARERSVTRASPS